MLFGKGNAMEHVDLRECTSKPDGDLENWAYSRFDFGVLESSGNQGMRVTYEGKVLAGSLESAKELLDSRFLLAGWLEWSHCEGYGTLPGFWIIRQDSAPNSSYIMLYWGAERWAKYEYEIDCEN